MVTSWHRKVGHTNIISWCTSSKATNNNNSNNNKIKSITIIREIHTLIKNNSLTTTPFPFIFPFLFTPYILKI